jgi:SAM-dependent methyltransferase
VKETAEDRFRSWLAALEARHLAELSFPEVRRALEALSSIYVERRDRLAAGAALDGAGKRAAFALYYGPLHFLVVREVVRALGAARPAPARILDLGCGTGAAGAAWAVEAGGGAEVLGIDASAWAVDEARFTARTLGVRAVFRKARIEGVRMPGRGAAIVAAYVLNEAADAARNRVLHRLIEAGRAGASVLVVEPIAKRPVPWWAGAAGAFVNAGGKEATWRVPVELPDRLRLLDRAAGLDHSTLSARTLWIGRRD